jgi:hypothetical protein
VYFYIYSIYSQILSYTLIYSIYTILSPAPLYIYIHYTPHSIPIYPYTHIPIYSIHTYTHTHIKGLAGRFKEFNDKRLAPLLMEKKRRQMQEMKTKVCMYIHIH